MAMAKSNKEIVPEPPPTAVRWKFLHEVTLDELWEAWYSGWYNGLAKKRAMWQHLVILLVSSGLLFSAPSSAKELPSPTTSETSELPAKVREFVGLMDDPQVRAWLAKQIEVKPVPVAPSDKPDAELNAFVAHFDLIRAHFAALAQVIPTLPEQFEQAAKVAGGQIEQHSFRRALFLLALFLGLGFGVEWLFWRATTRFQAHIDSLTLDTVRQRLLAVGMRFALGIGGIASFALGSFCAFLAFEWPSFLKQLVLGYLAAFLVLRLVVGIARFLLAPGGRTPGDVTRFRILPMTTHAARYWSRRLALIVGWFAFGWVTVMVLAQFGFSKEALQLFAYVLGLVLLGLGIEAVWRAPRSRKWGSDRTRGEEATPPRKGGRAQPLFRPALAAVGRGRVGDVLGRRHSRCTARLGHADGSGRRPSAAAAGA